MSHSIAESRPEEASCRVSPGPYRSGSRKSAGQDIAQRPRLEHSELSGATFRNRVAYFSTRSSRKATFRNLTPLFCMEDRRNGRSPLKPRSSPWEPPGGLLNATGNGPQETRSPPQMGGGLLLLLRCGRDRRARLVESSGWRDYSAVGVGFPSEPPWLPSPSPPALPD